MHFLHLIKQRAAREREREIDIVYIFERAQENILKQNPRQDIVVYIEGESDTEDSWNRTSIHIIILKGNDEQWRNHGGRRFQRRFIREQG